MGRMRRRGVRRGKGEDAGVYWGERFGRLWRIGVRRGSFDYAQDRLFALERCAQDDGKNRQPQVL